MKKTKDEAISTAISIMEDFAKGEDYLTACCKRAAVEYKTFNSWLTKYPELQPKFAEAKELQLKNKLSASADVALHSLHKLLTGYKTTVNKRKYMMVPDKEGGGSKEVLVERVETEIYIQPSIKAIHAELQRAYPKHYAVQDGLSPTLTLKTIEMAQKVEGGEVSSELFQSILELIALPMQVKEAIIKTLETSMNSVGIDVQIDQSEAYKRAAKTLNNLKHKTNETEDNIPETTD